MFWEIKYIQVICKGIDKLEVRINKLESHLHLTVSKYESLWIKVCLDKTKLIFLSVVYRPPRFRLRKYRSATTLAKAKWDFHFLAIIISFRSVELSKVFVFEAKDPPFLSPSIYNVVSHMQVACLYTTL